MAIYHCSIKMITRSAGRSVIACAAYRSGTELYDEELYETFDYTHKGGVEYSEISLCENAPERFLDRQNLWNSVQAIESNSNAQLAREFEVGLPLECDFEEWKTIAREYAVYMNKQGMIVDWSIHDPIDRETGLKDNPHVHMMCTTRAIASDGSWATKMTKTYKLDEFGERVPVIDKAKLAAFEEAHHMTYKEAIAQAKTAEERDQIKYEVQKIGSRNRRTWEREVTSMGVVMNILCCRKSYYLCAPWYCRVGRQCDSRRTCPTNTRGNRFRNRWLWHEGRIDGRFQARGQFGLHHR